MSKRFFLFTLLLVGAVSVSACNQSAPVSDQVEPVPINKPTQDLSGVDTIESDARVIDIEMTNYRFSEETITAEPGETLTLNVTSVEGFHDFVIDELDVQSDKIATNQETSITFTIPADVSGQEYEYYCSVGNHRQLGMVGRLVIN